MDGERSVSELPPPSLGEHTDEVLASLTIEPDELARLRSEGVVA
jgi:crotonobetainyl-CoA:carnitine CoA-transferase CaiB-like acyl-CoA transferase